MVRLVHLAERSPNTGQVLGNGDLTRNRDLRVFRQGYILLGAPADIPVNAELSLREELRASALSVVLSNLFILQSERYANFLDVNGEYEFWLHKCEVGFDGNSYSDPEDENPILTPIRFLIGLFVLKVCSHSK